MKIIEKLRHLTPDDAEFIPVSSAEITLIERHFSKPLPADYADFISVYGECGFDDDAFVEGCEVFTFFGSTGPSTALLRNIKVYDQITADGFLPFADDSFGNLFLMNMEDYSIWFRDFSPKAITPCRRIASNFTDFLDKLEIVPLDD